MRKALVVSCLGLCVALGCGHHDNGNGDVDAGPGGGGGCGVDCPDGMYCSVIGECIADDTCKADGDCNGSGQICAPDGTCQLGGCGGTHLDLTYVAPNLIFAVDRSCSMKKQIDATTTKWEAAVAAMQHVLGAYPTQIRWGATFFPDTTATDADACTQGAIPFPIADGNAQAISDALEAALDETNDLFPKDPCKTPIDTGMAQAAGDPALADAGRQSYVMLVTDGAQAGCSAGGSDDGTLQTIGALEAAGTKTFVIGFGSAVDEDALNKFADAGGEAQPGAQHFFVADSADSLDTAIQTIAEQVVSCQYLVDPAPDDLDETYVYFSGTELVPRDPTHANGWDFDAATSTLTLYGDDCARLQSLAVTQVDVIFGCPNPPIQ